MPFLRCVLTALSLINFMTARAHETATWHDAREFCVALLSNIRGNSSGFYSPTSVWKMHRVNALYSWRLKLKSSRHFSPESTEKLKFVICLLFRDRDASWHTHKFCINCISKYNRLQRGDEKYFSFAMYARCIVYFPFSLSLSLFDLYIYTF